MSYGTIFGGILAIATTLGLGFIRVSLLAYTVQTDYGIIKGEADNVIAAREKSLAPRTFISWRTFT